MALLNKTHADKYTTRREAAIEAAFLLKEFEASGKLPEASSAMISFELEEVCTSVRDAVNDRLIRDAVKTGEAIPPLPPSHLWFCGHNNHRVRYSEFWDVTQELGKEAFKASLRSFESRFQEYRLELALIDQGE